MFDQLSHKMTARSATLLVAIDNRLDRILKYWYRRRSTSWRPRTTSTSSSSTSIPSTTPPRRRTGPSRPTPRPTWARATCCWPSPPRARAYSVRVPPDFALSSSQLTEIDQNEIRPQLADGDWAGAAIAAANGYRSALGGSSSTWWWIAGGIVVLGGGGYLIYRRTRRKAEAETRTAGRTGRSATARLRNHWSNCPPGACRRSSTPTTPSGPANSNSRRPRPSSAMTRSRSSARRSTPPANR